MHYTGMAALRHVAADRMERRAGGGVGRSGGGCLDGGAVDLLLAEGREQAPRTHLSGGRPPRRWASRSAGCTTRDGGGPFSRGLGVPECHCAVGRHLEPAGGLAATLTLLGLTLFASIINGRIQESRLAGSLLIANAELQRRARASRHQIIERERAEVKLQAQLERLMLLDQITRAIGERQGSAKHLPGGQFAAWRRTTRGFACICRHDPADHALDHRPCRRAQRGRSRRNWSLDSSCIEIDQSGLSRCVRGELVYEADIQATPFPFQQRLARGGLRSLVVAPLQSEGQVFGILVAARLRPRAFSSGDCDFLRQLCAHVALAAQQAELYGALQQAYDDLRQTQQSVMDQERLRTLGQMASWHCARHQ